MTAAQLLADLDRLGVVLWAEGDRLCYRSPKGTLTPSLLARLKEGKSEILRLVTEPPGRSPARPALVPDPERRCEPFPLSDIQQAYLVGRAGHFDLGGVGPTSYVEVDWPGLDVARLEHAWRRLIARHDILRAVVEPGRRLRILPGELPWSLAILDLRAASPGAAEAALAAVRRSMSELLFDPASWPLFELRVTLLEEGRARLHVSRDLLIGDARSTDILVEELLHLYGDPAAGLPPLELSIRDYAVAMAALRDGEPYRRAQAYWHGRLPHLPPAPELPLVAAAPAGRHCFTRHRHAIASGDWARLAARGARAGLTPSALLCAAFAEVLAVWSGRPRFTLNVLYSNRLPLHPQVGGLVGNFASTILLAVDGRAATFEQRARRLQEQLWEDMEHGLVSGVEVLRELNRLHGPSTRATMPVVFSSVLPFAQGAAPGKPATPGPGPGPELVASGVQTPQVLLEMLVTEVSGVVEYTWNFVAAAFPPGLVAAMFEACGRLLTELAGSEEAWQRTSRALVPERDLARRRAVNATAAPEPGQRLEEMVAERAARTPGEIAVVAADRSLTYGELWRLAGALAHRLRLLGAGPDRLVAVVLEKGWEQALAILAVLRSGAAYLPIDPALPRERRFYLLQLGEVTIALTQPHRAADLDWPPGVLPLPVDGQADPGTGASIGSASPLAPAGGRGDLAYVLFTSGSTGLPKGVMIEHRGAANTIADVNRRFGLSPTDRVLALSSLSFDLSVWDVFGILAAGGRVVFPSPAASHDPACWHELLVREGITVWNSVPALMEILLDHLASRGDRLPPSLRLVMLSGDWIPVHLPDRIRALGGTVQVIALGGATEASIWSILFPVDAVDPGWKSIPYGRPMANQTFHVLDERLEPSPDWVPGHLYIGGTGLARGYWKDEAKTQASFFLHPATGERLYRTGDLGRHLPDGPIEFLGREDMQVKIQGYRVELGEIEAALLAHPAVREAVVTAAGEQKGHKRLVAYFVAADGEPPAAAELRTFVEAKLPKYMVPTLFLPLPALPLTPNGKVDRKGLPSPEPPRAGQGDSLSLPRSSAELRMARIWEEVTGIHPIGRADNFFELGGDSMLGLHLLAEVEKEFGRHLSLSALLQGGTIEHLAQLLADTGPASWSPLVTLQEGRERPFFWVHPVGGNVLCYVPLARHLGQGRAFYAFESQGLEGGRPPLDSIGAMAELYLAALRRVQPAGPYLLGGWSMGGIVAFEMARRLKAAGEEIDLLAAVDAQWPAAASGSAAPDEAAWIRSFAGDACRSAGFDELDLSLLDRAAPGQELACFCEQAHGAGLFPAAMDLAEVRHLFDVFKANWRALREHRPAPYPGRVTLLLAAGEPRNSSSPEVWRELATGGLDVDVLPGDHYSLLRPPHVAALAARLRERIGERP